MKRNLFLTILLLLCVVSVATARERITLKNGNVYEGYVSKSYVNGKIFFRAEKSVVNISDLSKINISINTYSLDELDSKWSEWVEANQIYLTVSNGKKSLNLSNIVGDKNICDVFILEQGENFLKYISFTEELVIFEGSEISSIESSPRSCLSLSGVNTEIQIKDSLAFTGEIVCKTADAIKLLTIDRSIKVLPYEKISKISKYRVNEHLPIIKQVPKLDFILLKNSNSVTGVITLETFDKNKEMEYLLVETGVGEHIHIKKSDIDYIEKLDNKDYVDIKDVEICPGEMLICNSLCDTIPLSYINDYFVINDTINPLSIDYDEFGARVNIILKDDASADSFKLLEVGRKSIETTVKRKKIVVQELLAFTYKDIVENSIKESDSFLSVNGNIHKTYKLKKGQYVFFNIENKKCYYFTLE